MKKIQKHAPVHFYLIPLSKKIIEITVIGEKPKKDHSDFSEHLLVPTREDDGLVVGLSEYLQTRCIFPAHRGQDSAPGYYRGRYLRSDIKRIVAWLKKHGAMRKP